MVEDDVVELETAVPVVLDVVEVVSLSRGPAAVDVPVEASEHETKKSKAAIERDHRIVIALTDIRRPPPEHGSLSCYWIRHQGIKLPGQKEASRPKQSGVRKSGI